MVAPAVAVPVVAAYTFLVGGIAKIYEKMNAKANNMSQSIADLKAAVIKDTVEQTQQALMVKPYLWCTLAFTVVSTVGWTILFFDNRRQQTIFERMLKSMLLMEERLLHLKYDEDADGSHPSEVGIRNEDLDAPEVQIPQVDSKSTPYENRSPRSVPSEADSPRSQNIQIHGVDHQHHTSSSSNQQKQIETGEQDKIVVNGVLYERSPRRKSLSVEREEVTRHGQQENSVASQKQDELMGHFEEMIKSLDIKLGQMKSQSSSLTKDIPQMNDQHMSDRAVISSLSEPGRTVLPERSATSSSSRRRAKAEVVKGEQSDISLKTKVYATDVQDAPARRAVTPELSQYSFASSPAQRNTTEVQGSYVRSVVSPERSEYSLQSAPGQSSKAEILVSSPPRAVSAEPSQYSLQSAPSHTHKRDMQDAEANHAVGPEPTNYSLQSAPSHANTRDVQDALPQHVVRPEPTQYSLQSAPSHKNIRDVQDSVAQLLVRPEPTQYSLQSAPAPSRDQNIHFESSPSKVTLDVAQTDEFVDASLAQSSNIPPQQTRLYSTETPPGAVNVSTERTDRSEPSIIRTNRSILSPIVISPTESDLHRELSVDSALEILHRRSFGTTPKSSSAAQGKATNAAASLANEPPHISREQSAQSRLHPTAQATDVSVQQQGDCSLTKTTNQDVPSNAPKSGKMSLEHQAITRPEASGPNVVDQEKTFDSAVERFAIYTEPSSPNAVQHEKSHRSTVKLFEGDLGKGCVSPHHVYDKSLDTIGQPDLSTEELLEQQSWSAEVHAQPNHRDADIEVHQKQTIGQRSEISARDAEISTLQPAPQQPSIPANSRAFSPPKQSAQEISNIPNRGSSSSAPMQRQVSPKKIRFSRTQKEQVVEKEIARPLVDEIIRPSATSEQRHYESDRLAAQVVEQDITVGAPSSSQPAAFLSNAPPDPNSVAKEISDVPAYLSPNLDRQVSPKKIRFSRKTEKIDDRIPASQEIAQTAFQDISVGAASSSQPTAFLPNVPPDPNSDVKQISEAPGDLSANPDRQVSPKKIGFSRKSGANAITIDDRIPATIHEDENILDENRTYVLEPWTEDPVDRVAAQAVVQNVLSSAASSSLTPSTEPIPAEPVDLVVEESLAADMRIPEPIPQDIQESTVEKHVPSNLLGQDMGDSTDREGAKTLVQNVVTNAELLRKVQAAPVVDRSTGSQQPFDVGSVDIADSSDEHHEEVAMHESKQPEMSVEASDHFSQEIIATSFQQNDAAQPAAPVEPEAVVVDGKQWQSPFDEPDALDKIVEQVVDQIINEAVEESVSEPIVATTQNITNGLPISARDVVTPTSREAQQFQVQNVMTSAELLEGSSVINEKSSGSQQILEIGDGNQVSEEDRNTQAVLLSGQQWRSPFDEPGVLDTIVDQVVKQIINEAVQESASDPSVAPTLSEQSNIFDSLHLPADREAAETLVRNVITSAELLQKIQHAPVVNERSAGSDQPRDVDSIEPSDTDVKTDVECEAADAPLDVGRWQNPFDEPELLDRIVDEVVDQIIKEVREQNASNPIPIPAPSATVEQQVIDARAELPDEITSGVAEVIEEVALHESRQPEMSVEASDHFSQEIIATSPKQNDAAQEAAPVQAEKETVTMADGTPIGSDFRQTAVFLPKTIPAGVFTERSTQSQVPEDSADPTIFEEDLEVEEVVINSQAEDSVQEMPSETSVQEVPVGASQQQLDEIMADNFKVIENTGTKKEDSLKELPVKEPVADTQGSHQPKSQQVDSIEVDDNEILYLSPERVAAQLVVQNAIIGAASSSPEKPKDAGVFEPEEILYGLETAPAHDEVSSPAGEPDVIDTATSPSKKSGRLMPIDYDALKQIAITLDEPQDSPNQEPDGIVSPDASPSNAAPTTPGQRVSKASPQRKKHRERFDHYGDPVEDIQLANESNKFDKVMNKAVDQSSEPIQQAAAGEAQKHEPKKVSFTKNTKSRKSMRLDHFGDFKEDTSLCKCNACDECLARIAIASEEVRENVPLHSSKLPEATVEASFVEKTSKRSERTDHFGSAEQIARDDVERRRSKRAKPRKPKNY